MADVVAVSRNEAIERLLGEIRKRLESAFENSQHVSVRFSDHLTANRISGVVSDGSCEYHIYIGPKGVRDGR